MMDAKLINPFINATLKVLETMAFIKAEADKPFLKKSSIARGDVSGIIGFTGDANGTVSVSFDESCILKIVSSMFGEEITEVNSEITDAVGEIANMISGQARQELEGIGKSFQAAIPSVVSGKDHEIKTNSKGPKIAIPFATAAGSFTIEVCLEG